MDTETQRQFLESYKTYVEATLEPTQRELKDLLAGWKRPGYWSKYSKRGRLPDPSPVQRTHTRIKRPESVVDKILRKSTDFPEGLRPPSFVKMQDALGARVIVYFISQIPLIDNEIRNNGSFDVSSAIPPIAYLGPDLHKQLTLSHIDRRDKESGYAAVHYVLRLRNSTLPSHDRPWFELQLRTLCEDLWGEIEHILGYKPDKRTSFAVRKQFRIISRELEAIDEHFNFLFEELSRFQEEGNFQDADPLNAENLPPVLAEVGLSCAQREIDGLLKVLVSRGLRSVGELRSVATARRLEVIRNNYRLVEGRHPMNFEVVANLCNLIEVTDEEEMTSRIRAQIEFLKVWASIKEENWE